MLDFALIVEPPDLSRYTSTKHSGTIVGALLMRDDDSLARLSAILPTDLEGVPVICSKQSLAVGIPR